MSAAIDLQRFCARKHDDREHLHAPWPHKGRLYASNGHIMVRIPSPEHAEAVATHPAAMADQMFEAAGKAGYIALPAFEAPMRCDSCAGEGKYLQVECPDCEGKGEFTHGTCLYDCQRCFGDGLIRASELDVGAAMHDCSHCGGLGYFRGEGARIGDATYDRVYLRLLSTLSGVRVCVNGEKAMHFTFDGGDGLLMPYREAA